MNEKKSVIVFAPHLKYPPRNGADIYVEKIGKYLSFSNRDVIIVGANTVTYYQHGQVVKEQSFRNDFRLKQWAAFRTIVFNSHYLLEKFLTRAYRKKAQKIARQYPQSNIIYSLIMSTALKLKSNHAIVLTHNDEILWFENQSKFSRNPFEKKIARISKDWVKEFFKTGSNFFFFAHITENDYQGYLRWMPNHTGFVVPAGVEIKKISYSSSAGDEKIRLLFVGSLSVKMNYDALVFFQKKFWYVLKNEFNQNIEMTVLGSQPSSAVQKLCIQENWLLLSDASEDELRAQYESATFFVAPFPYTNGAKLKVLNALAMGLPVIATSNMIFLPNQDFSPNLYSDEPKQWINHLKAMKRVATSNAHREMCRNYASQYSWEKAVSKLDKIMD